MHFYFPPEVHFSLPFPEGAEYAAITHGHPSGYLTAGFLSGMVSYIIEGKTLAEAIDLCIEQLTRYDGYSETLEKIELAQKLSVSQKPPEESIHAIGEGWVGEEALAISLYCSLKFSDNFERGTLYFRSKRIFPSRNIHHFSGAGFLLFKIV